jgi:hypothetical protein
MYKVREDLIVTPAQAAWESARRWLGWLGLLAILALLVFVIWPRNRMVTDGGDVYARTPITYPSVWPSWLLLPPGTLINQVYKGGWNQADIGDDIMIGTAGVAPMGLAGIKTYWKNLVVKKGFALTKEDKIGDGTSLSFERISSDNREALWIASRPFPAPLPYNIYARYRYTLFVVTYYSFSVIKPIVLPSP